MVRAETSTLARVAVLAAMGNAKGLSELAESKSFRRIPKRKVSETLLEVHLFAGFPAAIEGFSVLSNYLKPNSGPKRSMDRRERKTRGELICRKIYGKKYDSLMKKMSLLHPELRLWMVEDGYGKVLSRPGLSLRQRELIAVAVLATLGWSKQLNSHIIGCMDAGAQIGDVRIILDAITPLITHRRAQDARRILETRYPSKS